MRFVTDEKSKKEYKDGKKALKKGWKKYKKGKKKFEKKKPEAEKQLQSGKEQLDELADQISEDEQTYQSLQLQIDTLEKAKALPCVFNNWAAFYRGKFVTVNLLDAAALKRLVKK